MYIGHDCYDELLMDEFENAAFKNDIGYRPASQKEQKNTTRTCVKGILEM